MKPQNYRTDVNIFSIYMGGSTFSSRGRLEITSSVKGIIILPRSCNKTRYYNIQIILNKHKELFKSTLKLIMLKIENEKTLYNNTNRQGQGAKFHAIYGGFG